MVHDMVHDKANEAQNYEVHDVRLAILREARTFVHQSLYFFQSWVIFVFIPCFIGVILRKMEFWKNVKSRGMGWKIKESMTMYGRFL